MAVGEQEIVPWEQPVTEVRWVRDGKVVAFWDGMIIRWSNSVATSHAFATHGKGRKPVRSTGVL